MTVENEARRFEEQATKIVDSVREYTDSPYHGGGWSFDMDRDEAIQFVSTILTKTCVQKKPDKPEPIQERRAWPIRDI
jgi:hypothetical protein